MPVIVTGAQLPLARRIAARLLEEGGEVRAFGSGAMGSLRAAGVFVATGGWADEGRLEAAMEQAHTVVHVGGGVHTADPRRIVEEARVVARAATGAGVRRLVLLSLPGAVPGADEPIRAAKAAAEAHVAAVPCPTVVLRLGLVDSPWLRDALATAGLGAELLAREVAPVRSEDVVELVAAVDRARSRAADGHLVLAADGPRWTSLQGYLERVAVRGPGAGTLVGRRLPDPAAVTRLEALLRGPWVSDDVPRLDGWDLMGLVPAAPWPGHEVAQ